MTDYTHYIGGGDIYTWIEGGCYAAGVPYSGYWLRGLLTLIKRESSTEPNAVNKWDSNAHGPVQSDGAPEGCSRGLCQVIPSTFEEFRPQSGNDRIYDPVTNIAAAIRYIRQRYDVIESGVNLSGKVQQADPTRPPRGY